MAEATDDGRKVLVFSLFRGQAEAERRILAAERARLGIAARA